MKTVFLAGGIGSGKSTVAHELEELGACRIDLDQLSRDVLAPGSPLTKEIAQVFGADLLDATTGELNRRLLASRAFATKEDAALLEALEIPAIEDLLVERVEALRASDNPPALCVVEVPLLDRVQDIRALADEVLVVMCPLVQRRARAIGRGMSGHDFDARAANQPTDEWLREHATSIIDNTGDYEQLKARIRTWYEEHVLNATGADR
ncbi:MAG: dephospho-CoA kinase [Atopobiaceae bacterium]|nr:dephospho-CoA kinase [Atopobiaceae bacterium]